MEVIPAIRPFRNEIRWGGALAFQFIGPPGAVTRTGVQQLISVNETPSRVWDLLLNLEPADGTPVLAGSRLLGNFTVELGVGSIVTRFFRQLEISVAFVGSQQTGVQLNLVFPASSFVVQGELILDASPAQLFPLSTRIACLAAPRMPFLATLEDEQWQ